VDELTVAMRARELIGKVGPLAIPVSIEAYLDHVGAVLRVRYDMEPNEAGMSFKSKDKHIICVNGRDSLERQRFTACHELAHIVLGLPSEHADHPSWSYAKRSPNEINCDVFASELLLPHKLFKPQVDAAEMGLAAIDDLVKVFQASSMAVGSRFAAFSGELCAFVLSEQGKVRYCSRSPSLREARTWVSPGTALPSGSVSQRVRGGAAPGGPEEVEPDVWFGDWDREGSLFEDARHVAQWDQTIALLWFDDDGLPPPKQERRQWEEATYGLAELDGNLPWPGKRRRR